LSFTLPLTIIFILSLYATFMISLGQTLSIGIYRIPPDARLVKYSQCVPDNMIHVL
jgi:hypothetical protein